MSILCVKHISARICVYLDLRAVVAVSVATVRTKPDTPAHSAPRCAATKAADQEYTVDRYGDTVQFDHPFFQAVCMFLGEFLCLIAFNALLFRARSKGESFPTAKPHSRFIFILPAVCDMTATSLMYVGLTLTDASIFQMLRGSVVIFTGVFSVIFLKRKLHAHHWLGMVLVMGGTAIVGTASLPSVCASAGGGGSTDASKALVGNILVIVAQLIVATQMVVEEYMIGGYDIPALQVVGWEGTWGFIVLSCVLGIMYAVPAPATFCAYPPHCDHFEDAYDAFVQIGNNWKVGLYLGLNICSIAFFNYLVSCCTARCLHSSLLVTHTALASLPRLLLAAGCVHHQAHQRVHPHGA